MIVGSIFPYLSFAAITEQSGKSLLSNSDSASWKQSRLQHQRRAQEAQKVFRAVALGVQLLQRGKRRP